MSSYKSREFIDSDSSDSEDEPPKLSPVKAKKEKKAKKDKEKAKEKLKEKSKEKTSKGNLTLITDGTSIRTYMGTSPM